MERISHRKTYELVGYVYDADLGRTNPFPSSILTIGLLGYFTNNLFLACLALIVAAAFFTRQLINGNYWSPCYSFAFHLDIIEKEENDHRSSEERKE